MRLVGVNVHPVKSTAIRPLASSRVTPFGLQSDREWMVVDAEGHLVSARQHPELFRIVSDTPATDPGLDSALRLRAEGMPDLVLAQSDSSPVRAYVHSAEVRGVPVGADADRWVGQVLGRDDVRLLLCADPTSRRLDPAWANAADHTAFADSAPVTLASIRSLALLNEWVTETALERGEEAPEPLSINRFRPNLVIDGAPEAFVEDAWERVAIGEATFRVVAPVSRCVMTTINPETVEKSKEPIRTLARHRSWNGKTWFAVKLVPEGEGVVRIGDELVPR